MTESEQIQRIKKLELILKDIHSQALTYADAVRGDLPNEKRFGFIAKKCLIGLATKEKP